MMNLDRLSLDLLSCDLSNVDKLRRLLPIQRKLEVRPAEGVEAAGQRCRSVVLAALGHLPGGYKVVARVCSDQDVRDVEAVAAAANGPCLLWVDVLEGCEADSLFAALRATSLDSNTHMIITCDDEYSADAARVQSMEEFTESIGCEELEIEAESGIPGVLADELHEEFKLFCTFEGAPRGRLDGDDGDDEPAPEMGTEAEDISGCLLDAFEPETIVKAIQKHAIQDHPVLAVYRSDNSSAVLVRVNISDVAFLHMLRDRLLNDEFGTTLARVLQQPDAVRAAGARHLGQLLRISVDKSHFAERYESSILRLRTLTPHQREKLAECKAAGGDLHIRAPAGAGKTFLALHFIQELLLDEQQQARVLFSARNLPLAVFVVKWLAERMIERNQRGESNEGAKFGRKCLSRVHLLFQPVADGPRAVSLKDGVVVTKAVAAATKYDLLVVDEAHHVYRDEFRAALEGFQTERRMVLSDVSQGLTNTACFPDELTEVLLTEVVRSSKRIVAGAMRFQLQREDKLLTKCHHESEGPPLQSFLFDIEDGEERYDKYAAETVRAIEHVVSKFPRLSLHDRLAIIVPNSDFRTELAPLLERRLASSLPDREFELVDAARASAAVTVCSAEAPKSEWLVLDGIEQMDGLEKLIVVCVGLDAAKNAAESTLETRSMLYRAITRAHMMVLAVNEHLPDGWFSFLTTIRLSEDRKFNAKKALAAAKVDTEATDRDVAAAVAQRQKREEEVADVLEVHSSGAVITADQLLFLKSRMLAALGSGISAAEALAGALEAWKLKSDAAIQKQELDNRVAEAATAAGITGPASLILLKKAAAAKLQRGGTFETSARVAIDDWQNARCTLERLVVEQGLRISDAELEHLVGVIIGKRASAQTALVEHLLSEAAKRHRLSLDFHLMQVLTQAVQTAAERGCGMEVAIKDVVDECLRLEASLVAEAKRRQINTRGPNGWIVIADLVPICRNLESGQTMGQVVSKAVDDWQIRAEAMEAERRRRNLVVQSIWDPSTNVTFAPATTKTKPEPESVFGVIASPVDRSVSLRWLLDFVAQNRGKRISFRRREFLAPEDGGGNEAGIDVTAETLSSHRIKRRASEAAGTGHPVTVRYSGILFEAMTTVDLMEAMIRPVARTHHKSFAEAKIRLEATGPPTYF
eukprot:SAG22_NODE_1126_length_5474_cov_4.748093_2_plen_1153_part_01